jgi:hypothetical protein
MIRRPRRSLPASLVALALLAAMVLIAVACVQLLVGGPPVLPFAAMADYGRSLHWDQPVTLMLGGVAAAVGLLLLGCAWIPGKPTVLALAGREGQTEAGATRASLRRVLSSAADGVDGVAKARIRIGKRQIRAKVSTGLRDATGICDQVRTALEERLAAIAPRRRFRLRVRVATIRSS